MTELRKLLIDKYPSFDITSQHLGKILRDNNKTRKITKHQHFPATRYGIEVNKQQELDKFYHEVNKYPIHKIICLDETSIQPAMMLEYSRCQLGKKCVVKTDDNYVFRKFTLLVAINNSACVGSKLYQQGGMIRENPKPWKNNYALVHGLLRCKSGCGLWNRDVNGAKNIYKIAYNHINGLERPLYLCRSKQSDTLHDVSNHNLPVSN